MLEVSMRVKDDRRTDGKRQEILTCAQEIIRKEGIDNLSMRKIATMLSQTPGIMYHYFENKEAILTAIIAQGYMEIIATITQHATIKDIRENLMTTLCAYMQLMCEKDILFTLLMSSKDPEVRAQIDILSPDALKRKSILYLHMKIEEGVREHIFQCSDALLKTQWIWASTYGVISTLIHEQADKPMRDMLIQEHVTSVIKSLER